MVTGDEATAASRRAASRSALVARLDSLGDVIVSGPAIRAIAASAEVTLLCGPNGEPAARALPGVHEVLVWDCPWISNPAPPATPETLGELTQLLGDRVPEEAVILTSFHQSPLPLALMLRLAGVGRITAASVDYAGSLLDVRLRPGEDLDEEQPEPTRALEIAAAAGYRLPPDDDGRLHVRRPADVADLLGDDPGPYVVVHPGASVPSRRWPAGHHREAVRLLTAQGLRVVVTGGPGERELTRYVADGRATDLGGRTDFGRLAGVLAEAAAVIVSNTGPAHLAAAVGTPVVSLYSPVLPAIRWAPYGVPVEVLGDQDAPCRSTRARECPVPGHPCLSGVSPAEAVEACLRLAAPRLEAVRPAARTAATVPAAAHLPEQNGQLS
ncbi:MULTISPECIES: glycosyltransferase family 9 protein [unclassified Leifsonia]|uniref:glycosyltransferase family 9 protein n=1 Tax=unclassified Leifsonia TaxID=2663824 RepID=UPI0008A740E9|nr:MULTISPECIES: glycosyltransferase family 9 protein [unclassified Leifsonia]SEH54648.1 ADP-heptose:LPS heptosyltransferase [Leifsonia sp. CL154]SFL24388.1 ADP-heptose:LPS heptosyltransferase [Leifsonia sp. CL147]